jgi:arylformamidase
MMVYKHYSQEQLNNQYNNRLHVPEYADYLERWERSSRKTERENNVLKNIFFGIRPEECLDIFPSEEPLSKTMIFIHGGYWHLLDKSRFHFIAETFLKRNVTTVFINYPLAPAASMDVIVLSCYNAIRWLQENIIKFNGNPLQMYVMGHSAGGHLACMLSIEEGINLQAVISLSGLFRLEPLMLSNLNNVLGMDTETAKRNSPVYLEPRNFFPLLLVTGTDETDEFKNQSVDMYNSWKNKHNRLTLLQVHGKNHYSILDSVTEGDSSLQSKIFRLMNI